MLLGCCHCGETPSESTPPSVSESQSIDESASESSNESSLEVVSCWCVFPRRWTFTLPGPNRIGASACCAAYAGIRVLNFVSCTGSVASWETTERRSTTITDPTCNSGSSFPMFGLTINKGVTNTTITIGSNSGVFNLAYSVPNTSFNCLSPFTLQIVSPFGGGVSCYGTPSSFNVLFSPG